MNYSHERRALEIFCLIVRDNNWPGAAWGKMTDKNQLKKLHHGLLVSEIPGAVIMSSSCQTGY